MTSPAITTEVAAGLFVDRKPIPLQGVSVEAKIRDFCSRVTVTQRYRNQESDPVEAVYVFPLDETAAVCGFEALIDEVHVVGEVMEREKAFETYDDAIAEGHGAYLLDQERPDVFTASIGNIPPGKEVMVQISYVTELALEGDDLRFVLPTTVSPRYAPAEDRVGVGRTSAEAVNPPVEWNAPYGLELSIEIDMPSAIRSVESPSHPISVETTGRRSHVRLGGREASLDRDFVLLVQLSYPKEARGWIERTAEENVAMVSFQPRFESEESPCEIVFVIDRSGSMGGDSIAEARNALQLCLRSLTEGSRFNIVGFGSRYEMLFKKSQPYNEKTLAQASSHVKSINANLGGTEILSPLEEVLQQRPDPELPRQLFILTDGQVTNTTAVIKLIRKHSDSTRVFTFGVGAGASHHLVRGLARASGGAAEFIFPGERIEAKVMRQLKKALAPAVTNVKVDWGRLEVEQAPHRVPPVFSGGRVLVYGFLKRHLAGPAEVVLKAHSLEGDISAAVMLDPAQAREENLMATLAARAKIRDLEEGSSALHNHKGSLQRGRSDDRVKEEAVRLGVTYGLCSQWTSFVAVERRATPVEDGMQLRRVPVALTRGWGGLSEQGTVPGGFGTAVSTKHLMARSAPAAMPLAIVTRTLMRRPAHGAGLDSDSSLVLDEAADSIAAPPVDRTLDRLVQLQRADGSWDLTKDLAKILGKKLRSLEQAITDVAGDRDLARRAWATALAVRWLAVEAADLVDEWELLAKKANQWLLACPSSLPSGKSWVAEAAKYIG